MDTPTIIQLADTVKQNASLLDNYLTKSGRPHPSLAVDGAPLQIPHQEHDALNAKGALWSATRQLQGLILGPVGILFNIGV